SVRDELPPGRGEHTVDRAVVRGRGQWFGGPLVVVEDGVHGRLRAGEAQHPVVPAATLTQAYSPGVHAQRRGEDDVSVGDRILTEARALRVGRSPPCANLQRV